MKKVLALALFAVLLIGAFAGCGEKTDTKTLTVGASSTPHAEILEIAKKQMEKDGYTLNIKIYDDYIMPNTATESGDLDANFFQHQPYLTDFNKSNGTHLVSVCAVHYEPYGLYKGTASSLSELKDGDKIAVPNDGSNEARALYLLEAAGLLTMKKDVGFVATKKDIAENPHKYDIVEMEAALVPNCLDSVAMGVVNGNYALGAGLKIADALAVEDKASDSAKTYANILVVKEGNENNEAVQALVKALQTDEVREFIQSEYNGAVVAMF